MYKYLFTLYLSFSIVSIGYSQEFSCELNIDKDNCQLHLTNGDNIFDDKTWFIIRGWDYYQRDWVITPKITFYSSDEYSFPGANKKPMFISNDCESLAFNNFNGEDSQTFFEILALDENKLVLYNEKFCPDSCLLVTSQIRNDYENLLCESELCISDFGECEKGICFCQFGEIGRFCKGSYELHEEINSNSYQTMDSMMVIYTS